MSSSNHAAAGSEPTRASVMVVDDERINREIVGRLLIRNGYDVVCAVNGRDAAELVAQHDFDLVLLDVVMPEMDGFECLRQIRAVRSVTELPVIMVTAEADRDTIVNAFRQGANDFVTKPIDPEVTLARIATHVQLRMSQRALCKSEERYALAAKGSNDGLWDWDLVQSEVYYSPRWKEMLGYGEDEISSQPSEWFSRIHPDDQGKLQELVFQSRPKQETQVECEMRLRHRDGSYRWVLCSGVVLQNVAGIPVRMAGSLTDITEGKVGDSLTGLPNRLLFVERLERTIERTRRVGGGLFAALFIDLDNFKLVNDSLGHQAGDMLLIAVAQRLESILRSSDVVIAPDQGYTIARQGGDEFTVLIDQLHEVKDAQIVAERIIAAVSEPFNLDGNEAFVGASVGIAVGSVETTSAEEVLRQADTAMYHAKGEGRGRYRLFDPAMHQHAARRLQLEKDLRKAVKGEEFCLHYQPIVHLATNSISGFEALIRWNHPRNEVVRPDEFIPAAEELGLIGSLGSWVIRDACRQGVEWQRQFRDAPPLTISLNCSIRQFYRPSFLDEVCRIIDDSGADPRLLKIEVTESTLMDKPDIVCPVLEGLRKLGVRIGIDDFGTGYSSLAYLHRLPLDVLKVDRSFVSAMNGSDENREIVHTIITLGRSLGLDVVAEGVETEQQRDLLIELGCTHAQGYLFSKPVPANEVERLLDLWRRHMKHDLSAVFAAESLAMLPTIPAAT
jgi:diguanylate cyclase (GGDEF)-like protein/PAS domain S-box-containing protein